MLKNKSKLGLFALALVALLICGCYIISGTWVIVEPFEFTSASGFYFYQIDITGEKDWIDHKDDINNIDLVGFEMFIINNESSDVTFNAYIDDADSTLCTDATCFNANTTKTLIIDNLTLPAGDTTHVTYGQSFKYLRHVDRLKALTKEGRFNYYGTASAGASLNFVIDSAVVIITFSASGS